MAGVGRRRGAPRDGFGGLGFHGETNRLNRQRGFLLPSYSFCIRDSLCVGLNIFVICMTNMKLSFALPFSREKSYVVGFIMGHLLDPHD